MSINQLKIQPDENVRTVKSRFGEFIVKLDNALLFPYGMIGMPEHTSFVLLESPFEKFQDFKLLQSLISDELVFMVLPIAHENKIIAQEDLDHAYKMIEIEKDNAVVLLIASTILNEEGKSVITVNARAPVFIDITQKAGMQFVLHNPEYEVQRPL